MTENAPAYSTVHAIPSVETYRHLRTAAGLSAKTCLLYTSPSPRDS